MKKKFLTLLLAGFAFAAGARTSIDSTAVIQIGGIKQFITVSGTNRANPLLLFITGGPGESSIGQSGRFTTELKKHFVLVEWDQRGCGKTQKLNKSPVPITLTVCENDTHQVADYLLKYFHRQKLFVMGWSWGTVLGFDMAKSYPQKLYAYFAVSPVINQLESERMGLVMMKEKAQKTNNKAAIAELAQVKIPFENMDQVFYARKWLFFFDGQKIDDKTLKDYFQSPDHKWIITLFNEASKQNLTKELPEVQCPVYFFVGKNDEQTNHVIGEAYFKELKAPTKQLFLFEKSGHAVPYSESAAFQKDIIGTVSQSMGTKN
jgi:pimeloyl-ACP methyl ester carboxylesterase